MEFSSPNNQSQMAREEVDPEDVMVHQLEPLVLFESQVLEVQEAWTRGGPKCLQLRLNQSKRVYE